MTVLLFARYGGALVCLLTDVLGADWERWLHPDG
jgi:hypothetical protein